jgi:hypothetical protein
MKKKTVKKLSLSRETVRGLTDDLGRAVGASPDKADETLTGRCHTFAIMCETASNYPVCVD